MLFEYKLSFKEWFKNFLEVSSKLGPHETYRGRQFDIFSVHDSFLIKDQLKDMGFKFNPKDKSWFMMRNDKFGRGFSTLTNDDFQKLAKLGVDTTSIGGMPATQVQMKPTQASQAPIQAGLTPRAELKTAPSQTEVPSTTPSAIQSFDAEKYRINPEWVTEHQKGVREVFQRSNSNIILPALAGSGKTTMLKDLASNAKEGEKWLYLVFNKKNQLESQKLFPPGVDVFTSHSFLERKVFSLNPQKIPKTDVFDKNKHDPEGYSEQKAEKLVNSIVFGKNSYVPDADKGFVKNNSFELLSKAKNFAVDPNKNDLETKLIEILKKYNIETTTEQGQDYKPQIVSIASQILQDMLPNVRGGDYALRNLRDHDDTLWWAAIHANELRWPHYDVVLADEVQDFNVCQQIMLKKLSEAGARIVAVGDENQAIYAFRGADAGSFSALNRILSNTNRGVQTRDLPVNFRSSPAIIDYVNKNTIVSNLQAGKSHAGMVKEDQTEDQARSIINDEWSKNGELSQETAFLARNNAALGPMALEMVVSDIPVTIVGRNLSDEFARFLTFALWYQDDPSLRYKKGSFAEIKRKGIKKFLDEKIDIIPSALDSYYDWRSSNPRMSQKQIKEEQRTVQNLSDLIGKLENNPKWIDSQGRQKTVETINDFLDYLKDKLRGLDLGTDGGGGNEKDMAIFDQRQKNPRRHVVLSTVHKSKGLEFDRVFILQNEKLPQHSESQRRKGTPMTQQEAQEENLKYVAYTRAKNQLHLINDPDEKR